MSGTSYDAIVGDDFGKWLAAQREGLGMSQAELGDALDVSRNTIARWERGERRVQSPAMLILAIEALASKAEEWVPARQPGDGLPVEGEVR